MTNETIIDDFCGKTPEDRAVLLAQLYAVQRVLARAQPATPAWPTGKRKAQPSLVPAVVPANEPEPSEPAPSNGAVDPDPVAPGPTDMF